MWLSSGSQTDFDDEKQNRKNDVGIPPEVNTDFNNEKQKEC